MRRLRLIVAMLIAGLLPAAAQPYNPVAIAPATPLSDAGLDAMRKQLGEAARRKDRAALAKLVVARNLFWWRQNRDTADKRKSGVDNLAAALGLNDKDSAGWDILAGYANDAGASPSAEYKGAYCAPADPSFNRKDFDELIKATRSDASEWGYPVSAGIEVHAGPQANAPVIDRLGLVSVRVMPEASPTSAAYVRIVTPSGRAGYVSIDAIAPIGNDQLCYVKDGDTWKIGGYIGGGEPQ
ncbi:MAG: hypothetical protein HY244_04400 [Rhizobiales bacterium]|nr:hypothetical protein [Hyphomicrobiales bacterium]